MDVEMTNVERNEIGAKGDRDGEPAAGLQDAGHLEDQRLPVPKVLEDVVSPHLADGGGLERAEGLRIVEVDLEVNAGSRPDIDVYIPRKGGTCRSQGSAATSGPLAG